MGNIIQKQILLLFCIVAAGCPVSDQNAGGKDYPLDVTAPEVSTADVQITEGEIFDPLDHLEFSDDTTWNPICTYMTDGTDLSSVGEHRITFTVSDEAGNITVRAMTLTVVKKPEPSPQPVPSPEPEPLYEAQPEYEPVYQEPIQNEEPVYVIEPSQQEHGTRYYMFADGYDMDSSYAACAADLAGIGYGSCVPLMNEEGIYTGYQLSY